MSSAIINLEGRDRELKRAFSKAIIFSGVAHFLLLIAIGIIGVQSQKPRLDEKSIQVRFLAAPRAKKAVAIKASAPAAKPPQATPPKPKPKKPKVIPKPELKPETVKKEDKPKPKPKEKKEIKPKKPKPKPKPEPEVDPAPLLPDDTMDDIELARNMLKESKTPKIAGQDDAQWHNAMAGIEGDLRMMHYHEEAGVWLRDAWRLPATVPSDTGLHVDVILRVDEAGNILDYEIINLSPHPDLNRSVEMLLEEIKKLPPLPYSTRGGFLKLPLRFEPGE